MRLIDADELKMCYMGKNSLGTNGNDSKADYTSIRKMIDAQPTAYDAEKVVEGLELENKRLKTLKNNCIALCDHEVIDIENKAYGYAIELVKRGGKAE